MNFHDFPINQSIIRTFLHNGEEKEYCFRRIYITKIKRSLKEVPSDPMLYGKYFETKCLGKSSGYDVKDLPRKKLTKKMEAENAVRKAEGKPLLPGEKYLDHIRVDDQINRFNALIKQHKIIIADHNVQVPILTVWDQDPDVLLSAELDVFPTTILIKLKDDVEPRLYAAIIDLKLTADINATYGDYCYGSPQYLDLIQAKMYHYVVRNINKKFNPTLSGLITNTIQSLIDKNLIVFLLWVFGYKKDVLEDKFIDVSWDKTKEAELHESIRKTVSSLEAGEKLDWPTNPVFHLCKSCPWFACPDRVRIQTV
ncbi:MAG: hypothetical protein UR43_C0028G0003 [candidate division TM6 bacterium GW2011_GWF2_33_332]|nr:MAG: hypothetical protein UR43_C0028G0003 [candidate division TM6 bacterium GW2011_GWF2_33_332]